jgi:hypothetical protein
MNHEKEIVLPAIKAVDKWLHLLPTDVQNGLKLAASVIESHGGATAEEMNRELGDNWVLARRTPAMIAKYGKSVKCYSYKFYGKAQRRALLKRFPGVCEEILHAIGAAYSK